MMRKAESRMQKAAAKMTLLAVIAACGFAGTAGCADRSSPAAMTSSGAIPAASSKPAADMPQSAARSNDNPSSSDSPAKPQAASAKPDGSRLPARDITFDTVKFDMQKDEPFVRKMITPAIEKLASSKIRIRGYILPSFQQSGLTQFVLVRDNMQCCFGPGAALYDCIVVKMEDGKSTDFTTRPVAVEGVFSIEEIRGPDDKCLAIYHLQGEKVQ